MTHQTMHAHITRQPPTASVTYLHDYKLERDISEMHSRLIGSTDRFEKRMCAARICCLIGLRTHDQVARMERAKGLI